jgi:short-subunit dehydrogenase
MNNETALITGASSGIGLHLASEFASHGHPVVLVAPSEDEFQKVAPELKAKHQVDARAIAKDLEQPNAAQEIFDSLQAKGVKIDILVNNALLRLLDSCNSCDSFLKPTAAPPPTPFAAVAAATYPDTSK